MYPATFFKDLLFFFQFPYDRDLIFIIQDRFRSFLEFCYPPVIYHIVTAWLNSHCRVHVGPDFILMKKYIPSLFQEILQVLLHLSGNHAWLDKA